MIYISSSVEELHILIYYYIALTIIWLIDEHAEQPMPCISYIYAKIEIKNEISYLKLKPEILLKEKRYVTIPIKSCWLGEIYYLVG